MLRISSLLREAYGNDSSFRAAGQNRSGVVVIWNLTNRCNLSCRHCYADANSTCSGRGEELSTQEAKRVIDDLARLDVLVLILSGGEPMLREDLYQLASYAREQGISCALSTNGTLIDEAQARKIGESGVRYVGISIDGGKDQHDEFRGRRGAYEASLQGIRLAREVGIKVGLRFSLTSYTASQLPFVFDLFEHESLKKLYISHLNYSNLVRRHLAPGPTETRNLMGLVIEKAMGYLKEKCLPREIVTGNNEADAPFLFLSVRRRHPELANWIYDALMRSRGNGLGPRLANIDAWGEVHPDPFCREISLGNVRQKAFDRILSDAQDHFFFSLRDRKAAFNGRCGRCQFVGLCGGNSRARAFAQFSDWLGSDPLCYLTDEEISLN